LRESFGKPPQKQDYAIGSIESYHVYRSASVDILERVDALTWNDLDMDKVFRRINACQSSVGEEYLYSCLHEPQFNLEKLELREKFISRMSEQPETCFKIRMRLARLGKVNFNGLAELIYGVDKKALEPTDIYSVLAIMPILCAGLLFINILVGIVSVVAALTLNTVINLKNRRKIESSFTAVQYFLAMLFCCEKIKKIAGIQDEQHIARLCESFRVFKPLMRRSAENITASSNETGMLKEFSRAWFLSDIRNYNKIIGAIVKNKEQFHDLYKRLGEIDLAISVLSFRESLNFWCNPDFRDESRIDFKEIYHPLLSAPVMNDGFIYKNSIITGSNASGKSTFIKTLAVNGILAQSIFTCTAQVYAARPALVMTSMALRDDISEGESYFITEIKSLKRILDKIKEVYCVCYIDEILRGTNTTERIAASASILEYISGLDCLCLAASHDIELAEMLDGLVDNYHFREEIADRGMIFDYKIKNGVANTRNAIKLLRYMGFENAIVEKAENLADK